MSEPVPGYEPGLSDDLERLCSQCGKTRPRFYCWDENPDTTCPFGFTQHAGPVGSRPPGWFTTESSDSDPPHVHHVRESAPWWAEAFPQCKGKGHNDKP
jgi:hypothetical protein